jgi:hypothetical protein
LLLANILSCIAQALPWRLAACSAIAASIALSWKGSGWFLKTTATSLP